MLRFPADFDDHHGRAPCALPLALGTGTGSELRRPLGITIIGGLIVSQVLTLYTTPVVYLYFDRLQHWWDGVRGRRETEPLGIGGVEPQICAPEPFQPQEYVKACASANSFQWGLCSRSCAAMLLFRADDHAAAQRLHGRPEVQPARRPGVSRV